jgi:hypothetical protein
MKKFFSKNGFLILIAFVCTTTLALEMINGRFWLSDFRVYYYAVRSLISGDQVYLVPFGLSSGFYKYSPVSLLLFIPTLPFNFLTASILHFVFLGFAFWYTFTLILGILKKYFFTGVIRHETLLICIAFICILLYFTREMHLGNINIILLMISCMSLKSFIRKKNFTGSLLLGIVILIKPYYLLLALPLLLRKNRSALVFLGLVVLIGAAIPFLYPGMTTALGLYDDWFRIMLIHGENFPGTSSLEYFIRHNFFTGLPAFADYILIAVMLSMITVFVLTNLRKERNLVQTYVSGDIDFIFEWFLILAIFPVMFKSDWVQLLLSAPLLIFMIFHIYSNRKVMLIPGVVLLLLFYSINSDDLLGRDLSGKLQEMGMMGFSNFLLVIYTFFVFLDFKKAKDAGSVPAVKSALP